MKPAAKPTSAFAGMRDALASPERLLRLVSPMAGLGFFGLALWALQHSLGAYRYEDVVAALAAFPPERLALSLGFAAAGYLSLVGYDFLAFRSIRRAIPLQAMAAGSLISNALGNSLGSTLLMGGAVRYWIYNSLGLSTAQIARVVLFCSIGFWLGYLFLVGVLSALTPIVLPAGLHALGAMAQPLGIASLAILAAYVGLSAAGKPLKLGQWRIELPDAGPIVGQILVASVDLCLMGMVLYVLMQPDIGLSYARFLPLFLIALITGSASQVPGGLGVFETAMLVLLSPWIDGRKLAAALLVFRGVYFVLPLVLAVLFVACRESWWQKIGARSLLRGGERWLPALTPQVLAAAAFIGGALLLLSGAAPAASGIGLANRLETLPVMEVSPFAASLVGVMLLVLARGLQRRLDGAWLLVMALLAAGCLLSLTSDQDVEAATVLGVGCTALLPFRQYFYRQSSLLREPFRAPCVAALAIAVAGISWLLLFAYSHADYADQPWWHFILRHDASGFLRATVAALVLAVLLSLHRLIRPVRVPFSPATWAEIERARPLVERSEHTHANLVFRGDKALLFSRAGDAFLMYGRHGRSWIAMGDPVGSEDGVRELLERFRELCDRADGWCVFFEVRPENRGLYADLGLDFTPLGEEARVALGSFSLDAPECRNLRQKRVRLLRAGCEFEILPREAVAAALPALGRVSSAWLARKATREKGFSNASFDARYLTNFPVAVVRRGSEIIAFANLWLGAGKEELSIDLMRHLPDTPNGTMDFLFAELLAWGQAQGFRWFNFGVAPLSGLDGPIGPPLWKHIGTFFYRHGGRFYNFHGLRRYKAKFNPVWSHLYLASPGGLALAPVLMDVAALMAGSLSGIVSKYPGRPGMRP